MVSFNPLTDLSVDPITRQTLWDMWGDAALGSISESDLAPEVKPIVAQDSPPTEAPGRLWWSTLERLMFVYTDELDGTGVSLWLAWGPDRFDCACLAAEPIPPGAIVESWYDRWIKVVDPTNGALGDGIMRPIGCNQSGVAWPLNEATSSTTASGAWCAVGIDGLVYVMHADSSNLSTSWYRPSVQEWLGVDDRNRGGTIVSVGFNPVDFDYVIGLSLYQFPIGAFQTSLPNQTYYSRIYWTGLRRTGKSNLGS